MKALLLSLAVLYPLASAAPAQERLELERGDRLVFLGDSITHAGFYVEPIESMLWCLHPELELEFFNAGVSGDVAAQAAERLEAEVIAQDPAVVFVLLGMNDAGYAPLDEAGLLRYRAGLDGIVRRLKQETDADVVVLSPTYYDPAPLQKRGDQPVAGYNDTLLRYGATGREVAREHGCTFVDVNKPMARATKLMRGSDPDFTMVPDGVHPDEIGGLVIADAVLQSVLGEVETQRLVVPVPGGDEQVFRMTLTRRPVAVIQEAVLPVAEAIRFPERWLAYALDPSNLPEGRWEVTVGDGPAVELMGGESAEGAGVEVGVLAAKARKVRELNDRRRRLLWSDIRHEVWQIKSEPDPQERRARYARIHTETLALAWVKILELERQIRELLQPLEVEVRVRRMP